MATLTKPAVVPTYTVTVANAIVASIIMLRIYGGCWPTHAENESWLLAQTGRVRVRQDSPVFGARDFLIVLDTEQSVPALATAADGDVVPEDTRAWLEAVA